MSITYRKLSAFEARTHLGEVLDYIRYTKKPCLIERHGKAVAAIIDIAAFENSSKQVWQKNWVEIAVEQLKVHYRPKKIILFGSAARGELKDASDIDIFVIKDTDKRPLDRIDEAMEFIDADNPVDLHIYTPSEVEERLSLGDFFVEDVMKNGKVMYAEGADEE
jgi:prevent-host-death family protein